MKLREEIESLKEQSLAWSREYREQWEIDNLLDKLALSLCHENYYKWLGDILNRTKEGEK